VIVYGSMESETIEAERITTVLMDELSSDDFRK